LCVGDLILHLLRNAGQHLSATVPSLLNALATRIATAQSTIFTQVRSQVRFGVMITLQLTTLRESQQTLCLPFAYLLTVELDLTLNLLESMVVASPPGDPTASPKTGLEVVLGSWCDDAVDTVQGSYSIRVK